MSQEMDRRRIGTPDALAGPSQQPVVMSVNGLDGSHRRLSRASQFVATKPVEQLLGPGVTAEQVHDDGQARHTQWRGGRPRTDALRNHTAW